MKKAQSISINTIITAAIALAVLVIIFMITTGRLSLFNIGVNQATDCTQQCKGAGYNSGQPAQADATSTESNPSFTTCAPPAIRLPGSQMLEQGVKKSCCCYN